METTINYKGTTTQILKIPMRYFSSLTAKQKDETILSIRLIKNNLHNLPKGLSIQILNTLNDDWDYVYSKLKGQRVFKKNNIYYPLNFKEIIK